MGGAKAENVKSGMEVCARQLDGGTTQHTPEGETLQLLLQAALVFFLLHPLCPAAVILRAEWVGADMQRGCDNCGNSVPKTTV